MILQSVHLKGKAHPELCASGHVVLLSPSYQQVKEWEDAPRINTRPASFLRLSAHEGFQQSLLHGPPRGKHWLHRGQSGKPSVCTQLTCSKSRCRSLGGTLSIPREPSGSLWGAGRLRGDGQEGRGAAASKERGAGEGRLAGQMGGHRRGRVSLAPRVSAPLTATMWVGACHGRKSLVCSSVLTIL